MCLVTLWHTRCLDSELTRIGSFPMLQQTHVTGVHSHAFVVTLPFNIAKRGSEIYCITRPEEMWSDTCSVSKLFVHAASYVLDIYASTNYVGIHADLGEWTHSNQRTELVALLEFTLFELLNRFSRRV